MKRVVSADDTRQRLLDLLEKNAEWGQFFALLCEDGPDRLRAQAWQFHEEVGGRLDDVEVWLLVLASEYLPDSPAGADSDWQARKLLYVRAYQLVHPDVDDPAEREAYDKVRVLFGEGSFDEFRAALREWVRVGRQEARRLAS